MPLYWTIDSKARLFSAVAEGDVSLGDSFALLEALAGSGALTCRKLFDGRAAVLIKLFENPRPARNWLENQHLPQARA